MKHDDAEGQNSFAMKNMSEGSQSQPRSRYDEDAVLGKESYGVATTVGRRDRRLSRSGESDESILSHGQGGFPRGMAIMRTTEVEVRR